MALGSWRDSRVEAFLALREESQKQWKSAVSDAEATPK